jgi:rare lipoprotein A
MQLRILFDCWVRLALCAMLLALAGCGSAPKSPSLVSEAMPTRPSASATVAKPSPAVPVLPPAGSGRGAYYQDDGPGDRPPEGLQETPDPEPKLEPYSRRANRPYVVFGKTYTPITDDQPLVQRGIGSWYGKKFHGQKTSSGEPYDMYKVTAAHPTLPIPSYARVTNLGNGAQVIVRINDRGPFHSSRIIDLSFTAALKLGYLGKGSSQLEVERLLPAEIERIAAAKRSGRERAPADPAPFVAPILEEIASPGAISPVVERTDRSQLPTGGLAERDSILAAFSQPVPNESTVPPANVPAAAPNLAPGSSNDNFYLQLGAFGDAANAESARVQFAQNWAAVLPSIEVVQTGVLHRIYSGPFASRGKAAGAAKQLEDGGSAKPLIVQR